jgi:hypothetical protein
VRERLHSGDPHELIINSDAVSTALLQRPGCGTEVLPVPGSMTGPWTPSAWHLVGPMVSSTLGAQSRAHSVLRGGGGSRLTSDHRPGSHHLPEPHRTATQSLPVLKPGVVAHTYNPSTREDGTFEVSLNSLYGETLSHNQSIDNFSFKSQLCCFCAVCSRQSLRPSLGFNFSSSYNAA